MPSPSTYPLLRLAAVGLLAALTILAARPGAAQAPSDPDVLLQGFYWNVHPGDHARDDDGVWWDSLATRAQSLADAGFETVWIPSPFKGMGGRWSMGYDIYDHYDLGAYANKFTRRTRFGTVEEFEAMRDAFERAGLRTMVDAVLNHRDGGDAQRAVDCWYGGGAAPVRYNVFEPASGRYPATPRNFHPTSDECNEDAPYNDPVFAQDQAYFTDLDTVLDAGAPGGGWFYGPHRLGFNGDSLVAWGRYLVDDLGFDEVRVDAIKHIDPAFLAPWLVELDAGTQPFAVGEYFGATPEIKGYLDEVNRFNSAFPEPGAPGRDARLAGFDFGLRYALRDMANGGGAYDMRALNTAGLHASGVDAARVVTFVENHDMDRTGYVYADCGEPGALPFGATCTKLGTDYGHDPVVTRKMMAYAYILAAEGRPTVFWKDYVWFGLGDEIGRLMALRRTLAQGESAPLASLDPNPELPQDDVFVLRRAGTPGGRDGGLLVLNDAADRTLGGYVDSPHAGVHYRDYTDAFLFATTEVFADGRVRVEANAGDYAWYAPTGLYPRAPGTPAPAFDVEAAPGGALHFVALRAADAAGLMVNGAPIQPGDEVAVMGPSGDVTQAAGVGRIGLATRWDGAHDVLVEVLGNAGAQGDASRLAPGDPLRLVVYDASAGTYHEAGEVTWAPAGAALSFTPDRPASRGGAVSVDVTDAAGRFAAGAVSYVTGFTAGAGSGGGEDTDAPVLSGQINGRQYDGSARDDRPGDTGIATVSLSADAQNLQLAVAPFAPGASAATFTVTLVNARQQGKGTVVATDVAGNASTSWICSNGCPPPADPPPPPPPGEDTAPPSVTGAIQGNAFEGTATDSGPDASGIASVALGSDAVNLALTVAPFAPGASSVGFTVKLQNPRQPGSGTIVATDVAGNAGSLFVDSEDRARAGSGGAASLAALRTLEPEVRTEVLANRPNPFHARTTLHFTLAEPMPATLTVYDVLGRQVAVLADGALQAGLHEVRFDASALPSGVYFYRLDTPAGADAGRMLRLK